MWVVKSLIECVNRSADIRTGMVNGAPDLSGSAETLRHVNPTVSDSDPKRNHIYKSDHKHVSSSSDAPQ